MHEFGGYNMPIEYTGIMDEHLAVVNSVGVFDVSHMGEIWVKGPHALEFLQRVTSNDASVIPVGKAQIYLVHERGGGYRGRLHRLPLRAREVHDGGERFQYSEGLGVV